MLQLDRVEKTYTYKGQQIFALRQVTLQLDHGNFVAVCGPSGCGKSTMLFAAGGLLRPDDGIVRIKLVQVLVFRQNQNVEPHSFTDFAHLILKFFGTFLNNLSFSL